MRHRWVRSAAGADGHGGYDVPNVRAAVKVPPGRCFPRPAGPSDAGAPNGDRVRRPSTLPPRSFMVNVCLDHRALLTPPAGAWSTGQPRLPRTRSPTCRLTMVVGAPTLPRCECVRTVHRAI